jgi:hypothetical protein
VTRSSARLLLLSLLAAAACGDEPVGPGPDDVGRLEVVAGAGQVGAPGQLLPDPVGVRLVDGDGAPVSGTSLTFGTVPVGGRVTPGRVRTDSAGRATVRWRLAPDEGAQVLEVRGDPTSLPLEIDATAVPFPDVDAVVVGGVSGNQPLGALVDGRSSVGPSDDFRFLDVGPTVGIGDWREDGSNGEVTVFVPGGAMRYRAAPGFTAGPDTVRFGPEEPADIDIAVWLVAGPSSRPRVETALITAARIFEQEGLGVRIRSVEWREVGGVPADLLVFTCQRRVALQEAVGQDDARIDVYIVTSVDGSTSRGQACRIGGDFVALGSFAGPTLLAHELGHDLGLLHVDQFGAYFDVTNVMHSASDSRDNLTEGQIFRAQLNEVSVLNGLYRYREPAVLRACYYGSSPQCPPTELRLWADGSFGPWPGPGDAERSPSGPSRTEGSVPPAVAATALLESCGLHGGPGVEVPSGASGRGALRPPGPGAVPWDPATVARLLEEGPPAGVVARSREAATRRARANLRWLIARGGAPWTSGAPPEAVDGAVAAAAAEARLRARWRTELERLR